QQGTFAANALPAERLTFLKKTYGLVALALVGFAFLVAILVNTPTAGYVAQMMTGGYAWLIVLAVFTGVSYLANSLAYSGSSQAVQFAGLTLYVVAQAIIFLPLIYIATVLTGDNTLIVKAGITTGGLVAGLTALVLFTRKDFSFLGPILTIVSFAALGFIVAGIVFGFSFGTFFAFLMVIFAGGSLLYNTSNMLHRFRTDQYVAAALGLFASIALLFWYILQIFMGSSSRND
ncbi:MAG: Bax inhibitor-1 family protein, partial [Pyrinomonadaceae bacterium]